MATTMAGMEAHLSLEKGVAPRAEMEAMEAMEAMLMEGMVEIYLLNG
jgi:hypothetical protein